MHSEQPTTGVFNGNEIQHWDFETIDPELESHMNECPECKADLMCDVLDFWESSYELMGDWILDTKTNQYNPDESGEYSAIYNRDHNTIQVIHSRFYQYGNPCSPCYPGQVEFSSDGKFIAFSLPYDMLYPDDLPFNRLTARWIIKDKLEYKTYKLRNIYYRIKYRVKLLTMRLNKRRIENNS
jgi:hypothetical protein